jgi:hypothetical protein
MLLSFCSLLASGGGDDVRLMVLCRRAGRKCPMKTDDSQPSAAPTSSSPPRPAPRRRADFWRVLRISLNVLAVLAVLGVLLFLLRFAHC